MKKITHLIFVFFDLIVSVLSCNFGSVSSERISEETLKEGAQQVVIPPDAFPILYESGKHIFVPVILKDSVQTFLILDNGSNFLSLDSQFVAKNDHILNLRYEPRSFIRTQDSKHRKQSWCYRT